MDLVINSWRHSCEFLFFGGRGSSSLIGSRRKGIGQMSNVRWVVWTCGKSSQASTRSDALYYVSYTRSILTPVPDPSTPPPGYRPSPRSGMDVVKEIEDVPTTADKPNSDVVIVDCGELVEEEGGDASPAPAEAGAAAAAAEGGETEVEKPETD